MKASALAVSQNNSKATFPCLSGLEYLDSSAVPLAVAFSGGADSTALLHILLRSLPNPLHVLIVDHGLRAESAEEAEMAKSRALAMGATHVHVLPWHGNKPKTAIMEAARNARYALLRAYCAKHKINTLVTAHHADDQAETFLFRLAKGTGLDGLAGMPVWSSEQEQVRTWRPLLSHGHDELLRYCRENKLAWIEDPSNQNTDYARPRLRVVRQALAAEGFTTARLTKTAERTTRAVHALNVIASNVAASAVVADHSDASIKVDWKVLASQPDEIVLRVMSLAIGRIGHDVRLEALERLVTDIQNASKSQSYTLAGCVIKHMRRDNVVLICRENPCQRGKTP